MQAEDPGAKLARLLKEIGEKRVADGPSRVAHYDQQRAACAAQLRGVPLVHATSVEVADNVLTNKLLATRHALGRQPSKTEIYLGIQDVVYTSAGGMYPQHELAFVFSMIAEEGSCVEATPWDTGTLVKRPARIDLPKVPDPTRRKIYLAHALRAPEYRTYLVEYVASCFTCADDYLLGADPCFDDPTGLMARGADHVRSRSFEVRFKGNLRVEHGTLLRVFLDEGATNVHRVIGQLQALRVPYTKRRVEDGPLVDQVRSWLVTYLTDERLTVS